MIILYTTDCPKCKILEKKLDEAGVIYIRNNNVAEMLKLGFQESPMLKVGEEFYSYPAAIKWANAKKLGVS